MAGQTDARRTTGNDYIPFAVALPPDENNVNPRLVPGHTGRFEECCAAGQNCRAACWDMTYILRW